MQLALQHVQRLERFDPAYACPAIAVIAANDAARSNDAAFGHHPFPALARLVHDDDERTLVVRTFHRFAVMDFFRMQRAAQLRDWRDVRRLANRLASTCLQIQEYAVARAALLLGAEDDDVATQQRFDASEQRDLPMWLAMIDRASTTIAQANHRITLH